MKAGLLSVLAVLRSFRQDLASMCAAGDRILRPALCSVSGLLARKLPLRACFETQHNTKKPCSLEATNGGPLPC